MMYNYNFGVYFIESRDGKLFVGGRNGGSVIKKGHIFTHLLEADFSVDSGVKKYLGLKFVDNIFITVEFIEYYGMEISEISTGMSAEMIISGSINKLKLNYILASK